MPLNEKEVPVEVSEEKVDNPEKIETMEDDGGQSKPQTPVTEDIVEQVEPEEDDGCGVGLPVPQNPVRFQEPVRVTHVAPRPTVSRVPKTSPEPGSMLRHGIMVGGAVLGILVIYFLFFGRKKKKSATGPTIVEVTDVRTEEKKSEGDNTTNNKMSSPRIIFGDLRRNPSLAVAPPVQSS